MKDSDSSLISVECCKINPVCFNGFKMITFIRKLEVISCINKVVEIDTLLIGF